MAEKHALHEYQEDDVEEILSELDESHGYIAAHDMGLGKTTIGAEIILRGITRNEWTRVLLIALPDTHDAWVERIMLQADGEPPLPIRVMNGNTKDGQANLTRFMKHEPGIFIAGNAYLQEKDWHSIPERDDEYRVVFERDKSTGEILLSDRPRGVIGPALEPKQKMRSVRKKVYDRFARKPLDAVFFDEVQAIANRKAKGRQTILSIKAENRVALSGTWFNNKVENQWSIARWVWPGNGPDGEPYVETNFSRWSEVWLLREDVVSNSGRPVEGRFGNVKKVTGEKEPGAFAASLPGYIRRESHEKAPEPLLLFVDALPDQRRQLDELQEDLMAWVMDWQGNQAPLVVDMPMVLRTRLKQVCIAALSIEGTYPDEKVMIRSDAQSAKLAPLRWLLEEKWKGEPVLIYTDSKIGAHFIAERMARSGASVQVRSGDLTKKAREVQKQAFMRGEFQYLVATIPATSTGVDGLQTACNKLAWISHMDGNPSKNDQALARLFRQGRIITDPNHPAGGFEHARILMRDSVDIQSLESTLATAWQMRLALNAGQPAA
jgi:hypothetical protein